MSLRNSADLCRCRLVPTNTRLNSKFSWSRLHLEDNNVVQIKWSNDSMTYLDLSQILTENKTTEEPLHWDGEMFQSEVLDKCSVELSSLEKSAQTVSQVYKLMSKYGIVLVTGVEPSSVSHQIMTSVTISSR